MCCVDQLKPQPMSAVRWLGFMRNTGMIGVLLFVLLGQHVVAVQQDAGDDFDVAAFDTAVARMHEAAGAPGMAVAVLRNGQTLHAKGYGIAGPNGQPVTTQTAFQTGSITKSFVALVILQMASEGKLDLDDPVVRHVPTFRTASKSQSDRITIDHLVTHHSGLTTLDGNRANGVDSSLSGPAAAVAALAGVQLFAEPGTTFQYSNANYALLSHLIEVLDDRPFEQALKARIFEPLGMTNSFVQVPASDATAVATGYRLWFGAPRAWQPEPDAKPDRRMIGAGGVSSSIEDMARYVEAVRARDPRIVPAEADRLFVITPVYEQWGYAYGWFTNTAGDEPVFEHSGFTPGFYTLATMVPAKGQVVVVLTNMSGLAHGDLPRAVTHAALGWDPVRAAAPIGARIAIWSAVTAPLGLLIFLYKTGRRLLNRRQPMRPWVRGLNVGAVLGLIAGVYGVFIGFQTMIGVSFPTGYAFYPDLTATTVAAMALALLLAAGRLALVIRGG
jgi:CubicO group peptidase (beta-lactamase class C family)